MMKVCGNAHLLMMATGLCVWGQCRVAMCRFLRRSCILQVMPGKLLCGVDLGQAETDSGLGQSCRRLQCPFVPTLSPAARACLLATRPPCPS